MPRNGLTPYESALDFWADQRELEALYLRSNSQDAQRDQQYNDDALLTAAAYGIDRVERAMSPGGRD